jgi:trehalose-phosphatase
VKNALPPLLDDLRLRLARAPHVLLAVDFDGTLAPIVDRPQDAALPPRTADCLRELTQSPDCSIAVVSGRSISDLRPRIGLDVIYAGNHGLEIEGPGISFVHPTANVLRDAVEIASWDLEAAFLTVPGVLVERKGLTATLHYRQARAELADWIATTVRLILGPYRECLTLVRARKAWEIRPRTAWNKGAAVRYLLDRLPVRPLLVCAGDDTTDEDMFSVTSDAISIRIGRGVRTRARYLIRECDFLSCLQLLQSACGNSVALCVPANVS